MKVCGIDIGSVATKAVILSAKAGFRSDSLQVGTFAGEDEKILSKGLCLTGANPERAAEGLLCKILEEAGIRREDLGYILSTGYGRRSIKFGDETATEISCCAKGTRWIGSNLGEVRTVIDLGGQDMKVISLDENGDITDFIMNDKCAAGTGRFLEVMANVLGVNLEDLGELSLRSKNLIEISSTCTVFAESEVISLIAQGKNKEDIIAGLHSSIAARIVNLIREVGEKEVIFFCGGGAKNKGIQKALRDKLGMPVYVPSEPQFVIAIGAALIGKESLKGRQKSE